MAKKKNIKEKLKPIIYDEEKSAFNFNGGMDELTTKLVLHDFDWQNYSLKVSFPTKEYGKMKILFYYCAIETSLMVVKTKKKIHVFEFDNNIFKRNMIKFLQSHIDHLEEDRVFIGLQESVDFYNDVIQDPNTKQTKDDHWVVELLKNKGV